MTAADRIPDRAMEQGGSSRIWPVLMAGGSGTRLWPMSRGLFPKQFMPLAGERTMLQATLERLKGPLFHPPSILCNDDHRFIVAEQLRSLNMTPAALILEPVGRNTAPAATVAALSLIERDAEAVMLLAPADHVISDPQAFHAALLPALEAARAGALVTFGIRPDRPETGYGYIREGEPLPGHPSVRRIASFSEKPDAETAQRYLDEGGYSWNSGLFLMRAQSWLDEVKALAPALLDPAGAAIRESRKDLDFLRLDRDALERAPAVSIDYAVMEKTARGAVVAVDIGWSDVGSWDSLWEIGDRDTSGNVVRGDVLTVDSHHSYLRSESGLLATVGIEGLVVVVTDDAVLVADRTRAQDVRAIVERLKALDRPETLSHSTVYRPWGSFTAVDAGDGFQVKRITVAPGGRLSLQRHARRAEHWVVVKGTATVTRDGAVIELQANQSTYIPIGMAHRLENRQREPLHLIEVQSGAYLGEDDIERLEDVYGRD